MSDGAVFLIGLGGMSTGCALMTFTWSSITAGTYSDPLGKDLMVFLIFILPCLLTAFFMPFCMNSSVALFMRLGTHSLGAKLGLAQAWQMNVTSAAPLLCPLYQFFTYPASLQETATAP